MCFLFSLQHLSLLIPRRIERNIIINLHSYGSIRYSRQIERSLNFLDNVRKILKYQI